ncbi:MAG: GtrA family protein [Clostridia bacterium]|nr:GtrA family protein [Clostridia bacterium]
MKISSILRRVRIDFKTFIYKCLGLLKRKDIILYLVFGVLTTLVDWLVSFLLYRIWGDAIEANSFLIHGANALAWLCAVMFAFVTNRTWVFKSRRTGFFPVIGEFAAFAGGRIMTLLLQEGIFAVMFDWLGINEYIVKIAAAVIVVIINFFLGKLIFRKKSDSDRADDLVNETDNTEKEDIKGTEADTDCYDPANGTERN